MKRILLATAVAAFALLAAVPGASAREVFVPAYQEDAVFVLDAATGQQLGAPIPTGENTSPFTLAISPDGATAYTTNEGNGTVGVIDTRTKAVVGSIPLGGSPFGIAITPDGTRAFVSNPGDKTVSVIDLATRQTIGAPIPVGQASYGVAITPDGSRVFVPSSADDNVTVIDARTLQKVGAPITIGDNPYGLAITPDGARVLVANNDDASLSVIDAKTLQVIGAPIPVGDDPSGVSISPNGLRAYTGNHGSGTVSVVDLTTNAVIATVPGLSEPEFVPIAPSGRIGFVSEDKGVAGLDLATNLLTGSLSPMEGAGQGAVVPDQSPVAALAPPKRIRPGVAAKFSGSGSSDPDGAVAGYSWSFAGGPAQAAAATVDHTFSKPGKYTVSLTVSDNEGCSAASVFTGQTAYCSGNPAATVTKTVVVALPGVKAKCPKGLKGGCRVTMQAVKWQGKGEKRKLVPQSAVAKAKLKAGASKTIALKPKKKVRSKLASAKKILVRETRTYGDPAAARTTTTRVVKLKVVR